MEKIIILALLSIIAIGIYYMISSHDWRMQIRRDAKLLKSKDISNESFVKILNSYALEKRIPRKIHRLACKIIEHNIILDEKTINNIYFMHNHDFIIALLNNIALPNKDKILDNIILEYFTPMQHIITGEVRTLKKPSRKLKKIMKDYSTLIPRKDFFGGCTDNFYKAKHIDECSSAYFLTTTLD